MAPRSDGGLGLRVGEDAAPPTTAEAAQGGRNRHEAFQAPCHKSPTLLTLCPTPSHESSPPGPRLTAPNRRHMCTLHNCSFTQQQSPGLVRNICTASPRLVFENRDFNLVPVFGVLRCKAGPGLRGAPLRITLKIFNVHQNLNTRASCFRLPWLELNHFYAAK